MELNDLQKWLFIAAVWVIAAGTLMMGFGSRYAPHSAQGYPMALDRWTGHLIAKGFKDSSAEVNALGFERLLKDLQLKPEAVVNSGAGLQQQRLGTVQSETQPQPGSSEEKKYLFETDQTLNSGN